MNTSLSNLPWDWYSAIPEDDIEQFIMRFRTCLPEIFTEVTKSANDPVFILADMGELRWRGLIYLLFNYGNVYYAPEKILGIEPQSESIAGEQLYKAPVIAGKLLKAGVYATERAALVKELCAISDIPIPLIKQVQAECPGGKYTVAYFCGLHLGVRHFSSDAESDEPAPLSLDELM